MDVGIFLVGLDWKTQVTGEAGVDYLIGENLGHRGDVGISLRTPDCLEGIATASVTRLVPGITGKSGLVLATVMSLSLYEMGLIGQLWAKRLTQWSLMVRV